MREVITETAGLIRRNTAGFTASAVPTTLPTWYKHTHMFYESILSTNHCNESLLISLFPKNCENKSSKSNCTRKL